MANIHARNGSAWYSVPLGGCFQAHGYFYRFMYVLRQWYYEETLGVCTAGVNSLEYKNTVELNWGAFRNLVLL